MRRRVAKTRVFRNRKARLSPSFASLRSSAAKTGVTNEALFEYEFEVEKSADEALLGAGWLGDPR